MIVYRRNYSLTDFPSMKVIYFLLNKKKIVYIGHSISFANRIHAHKRGKRSKKAPLKKWTHFCFFETSTDEIEELESFYILKHLPIYNLQIPKNKLISNKDFLKLKSQS